MGTQAIQGRLWGRQPADWSAIQEPTAITGYRHTLQQLGDAKGRRLLDVGCGSGMFCRMAADAGFVVAGLDASGPLLKLAHGKTPAGIFREGDLERLPFTEKEFDVVTGFNSFQYAGDIPMALGEAKRVLKKGGILVAMIWGNMSDCEAASYIKVTGARLPPPPPGAPGPFSLSENNRLQELLENAGFSVESTEDVNADFIYADEETALKGLMSAGPAARLIETVGADESRKIFQDALQSYKQSDGQVVYRNKFRVVISRKP